MSQLISSISCKFSDKTAEIKSQIIQGCSSPKLRRYALREEKLTLSHLLHTARTYELANEHAESMETNINKSTYSANAEHVHFQSQPQQITQFRNVTKCRNCGGQFPHPRERPCPARGITCYACGRQNHFAKHCLSTQKRTQPSVPTVPMPTADRVHAVGETSTPTTHHSDEYTFQVTSQAPTRKPTVTVTFNSTPFTAVIDTGATVTVMSRQSFARLQPQPSLTSQSNPVFAYGSSTPLLIDGTFQAVLGYKSKSITSAVYVTAQEGETLLLRLHLPSV